MPATLLDVLTLRAIRKLADERTLARGEAYFHDGNVGALDADEYEVRAQVQGTQRYRVRIAAGPDEALEYECTCPVGEDATCCKHVVAVALSWLENAGEEVFAPSEKVEVAPRKKRRSKQDLVRDHLATLDENALREWLLEAASRDRGLRDKLLLSAQAKPGRDLASLKSAIRQVTRIPGFADRRGAAGYAERIDDLAQLLEGRIADGNAKLIDLIEQAIAQAEDALGHIDDSNGEIVPAILRLRDVHERACNQLAPDPVALAERLFRFQVDGEWDTFHSILPSYAHALGESGLARYRELVEDAWKRLPALGPEAIRTHFDIHRFQFEHAMEELTAFAGDIDQLVVVMSRNLSNPNAFLELAALLQRHGRHDEALQWAEKGLAAFPKERIDDLVSFCIAEHLRRGDGERAEYLAWQRFVRQPGSAAYFELVGVAKRIGRADDLAAKAVQHLWQLVRAEELPGKRLPSWHTLARSTLVAIHLREKDADKVWQVFRGGPVDVRLWADVAALRGKTHPDEAVKVYKELLSHAVDEGTRGAQYGEAFAIVNAIRALRIAQNQRARFLEELAEWRVAWMSKRNFMKLLAMLG
jgi:uncharacterized Zn finger protein